MSNCETCGRDDGHYIGCAEVPGTTGDLVTDFDAWLDTTCAFADCDKPRRPKGKGRAPIYCEDHSDPKNRK